MGISLNRKIYRKLKWELKVYKKDKGQREEFTITTYRRYQALLIGNVQIRTQLCTQVPQTSNLAHVAQTNVLHLKEMKRYTL